MRRISTDEVAYASYGGADVCERESVAASDTLESMVMRRESAQAGTTNSERRCVYCGAPIPQARLDAMPDANTCVACARKHPPKFDTRHIELSQASPINRNGFAPKD